MGTASASTVNLSIDELCRKYRNESVHTEHVAALAVRLFDETRRLLNFSASDRRILEAAGRLHDVAYGIDPRHHRDRGAEIVLRDDLDGFTDTERAVIAGVMLCHSGDWEATRRHPLVIHLPDPQRALRLGAILRIADGLDFGHIQDAAIVSVRFSGRKVLVTVRSPLFPYNLDRADQKADLWRGTFAVDVQFVQARPTKHPWELLGSEIGVHEAARRLVALQFKIIVTSAEGVLQDKNSEPLRNLRVAIRRLRTALRVFRKPLKGTSAESNDFMLERLNQILGPARDLDVWIEFLNDPEVQKQLAGNRRWAALMRYQLANRRLQQPTVRRHLSGPTFSALKLRISRLTRVELPRLIATELPVSPRKHAKRVLRKCLRRVVQLGKLRHSGSTDELHCLRVALRKARYMAEWFAPILGSSFDKLRKRIRAVERTVATIHDTDVGLTQISAQGPTPPRSLVRQLELHRRDYLGRLNQAWSRLEQMVARKEIRRQLKL